MAGPFPCPNTPSTCETNPNPSTGFSSEAQDSTTFIGLAWNNQVPALNKPFNVFPCEAITESQVSQADADIQASNQVVSCSNPCSPVFTNAPQSASGTCPNGSTYSLSFPAGIFTAESQVLADRKAFTAAVAALRGHSICLSSLAPTSVCRGEFYFGIISLVSTDLPASLVLVSGEVSDGLVLTLESDRAVVQGTPTSFGATRFTLQATSAVGVVTQQDYVVSVTGIVTGSVLTPGTEGTDYNAQLTAVIPDGSVAAWSIQAGTLPDGLDLDAATGAITGTPTTPGDSTFTIGVTAAGHTCTKQFSLHVASGVTPPHCLTNTSIAFTTFAGGSPDGPFNGTYSAAFQRAVLVFPSNNKIVFINTATNAVAATITMNTSGYTPGFRYHSIAFATSTQNFLFVNSTFTAMVVMDINGNTVGSLTPPVGTNFARTPWAYSPDTDRFYTLQHFSGTGTDHILEYNPHTLALTRDVDTGTSISGSGGVLCYPGNLLAWGSKLFNFPLSTLINDKSSGFFNTRGTIGYDPVSNRLFAGQNFSNDIQAFNVSDFSLSNDFSGANAGPYDFVVYNPVTQSIIGMDAFAEMVVIDPATNTVVCEFTPDPAGDGLVIDYATGEVYFYLFDGVNNPINVWD